MERRNYDVNVRKYGCADNHAVKLWNEQITLWVVFFSRFRHLVPFVSLRLILTLMCLVF